MGRPIEGMWWEGRSTCIKRWVTSPRNWPAPIESKLTGNFPGNTQDVLAVKKFPRRVSHAKYFKMLQQINLPCIPIELLIYFMFLFSSFSSPILVPFDMYIWRHKKYNLRIIEPSYIFPYHLHLFHHSKMVQLLKESVCKILSGKLFWKNEIPSIYVYIFANEKENLYSKLQLYPKLCFSNPNCVPIVKRKTSFFFPERTENRKSNSNWKLEHKRWRF